MPCVDFVMPGRNLKVDFNFHFSSFITTRKQYVFDCLTVTPIGELPQAISGLQASVARNALRTFSVG